MRNTFIFVQNRFGLRANMSLVTSGTGNVVTFLYCFCSNLMFSLIYNFTFDSIDSAKRAKETLNGADIYSGCCTLKIEYAKVRYSLLLFPIMW